MRVAIDIRRAADYGLGTYIRNIVNQLARIDNDSRYVLIGERRHVAEFDPLPGNFELLEYAHEPGTFRTHLHLPWLLRQRRVDILHMPWFYAPAIVPSRLLITVHDLSDVVAPQVGASPPVQTGRLFFAGRALNRADHIFAVSHASKRDLSRFFHIPESKITVVYDAVDERFLIEAFAVAKAELQGHPEFDQLKLLVIGEALNRHSDLRRAVVRARVREDVRFLGFVPRPVLRVFYSRALAFLFPSLYEGFGLPPLEAMAHGTPVLTSNVSSLPEVFQDAALLVNPENVFDIARGIRQILTENALRQTLRRRGYERAQMYSWQHAARLVHAAYHSVLTRSAA